MNCTFLFPTPVWNLETTEEDQSIVKDALSWALEYEKNHPSVKHSNRGGYLSHSEKFENLPYKEFIMNKLSRMSPNLLYYNWWVSIQRRGDFNFSHVHSEAHLSGIWYLTSNYNTLSLVGPYAYSRYRLNQELGLTNQVLVPANAGDMVIFPSDLEHFVEPHDSDEPRVLIGFNMRLR